MSSPVNFTQGAKRLKRKYRGRGRGRVVVTDRLHGHILSTLCGLPHVIIDPVNHKITSYMKSWTGGI